MDIHRVAAEVVSLLDGEIVKLGRVQMLRDKLEEFARKELTHDDHVVVEATGNAAAVAEVLSPYVDRIVIANPKQVHMIAHAKVKTDMIDATVLAKLYASGFLPEVWVPDPETLALRRQVTRRTQLVRQRSRLKNLIQSILHAHLIPPCPHGNLVGISGRKWLARQILPADERAAIERHLGLINQVNEALMVVEADIAVHALQDPTIRRLMTLPGLDVTVAASVAAAIGDIRRFSDPQRLVAYLGLNPSVRQSGEGPAYHGRITKQGRGHARGMLVEAAWAAARSPGPLRAFYKRIASRRGKHIAAVATARKLAKIIWHMLSKNADYIWARPALLARKFRSVELRAGLPTSHARRGTAFDYNIPAKRAEEQSRVEKAEAAYAAETSRWRTRPERQKAVEKAAE
ncbi:IS110 family transposase [Mesorhizobium sp.]|uniref:IS110 family transposase n=1 Tax=Mesorhizobium sp. TaxID=1871066 RepID=UPI000FE2B710|nr:IS110 family transposase [Mesorhizobium sp.]RWG80914.1 MAG: IS110 family transposase [Mesorhizobium sp.]RWI40883.1 MAG: IS110 family transposase [Mesorhizobium sp.]RWJ20606.1 MAG: IS110 family transposase [Mesorhizobium sp.]RWJ89670.1 MAG: IS110 family transposase [Mesorhizobium sp.]RWK15049.1 MAG: IS110 family transposase [Mesorhizobium sp.]